MTTDCPIVIHNGAAIQLLIAVFWSAIDRTLQLCGFNFCRDWRFPLILFNCPPGCTCWKRIWVAFVMAVWTFETKIFPAEWELAKCGGAPIIFQDTVVELCCCPAKQIDALQIFCSQTSSECPPFCSWQTKRHSDADPKLSEMKICRICWKQHVLKLRWMESASFETEGKHHHQSRNILLADCSATCEALCSSGKPLRQLQSGEAGGWRPQQLGHQLCAFGSDCCIDERRCGLLV